MPRRKGCEGVPMLDEALLEEGILVEVERLEQSVCTGIPRSATILIIIFTKEAT